MMTNVSGTDIRQAPAGAAPHLPDRKLDVGQAAVATWKVFRARAWTFIAIAFLSILASGLVIAASLAFGRSPDKAPVASVVSIATLVQYIVQFACQNATIYGGDRVISGMPFGVGEALGAGFRRLLPFLGAAILTALIVIAGLILLVIPGLIAAVALVLVAPACIIEGLGPVASIKRSLALTKGNRWRIIGAVLLGIVLPFFAIFIATSIVGAILAPLHLTALSFLLFIPAFLVFAAGAPLILSVLFNELRALKEGLGPRAAVSGVFD